MEKIKDRYDQEATHGLLTTESLSLLLFLFAFDAWLYALLRFPLQRRSSCACLLACCCIACRCVVGCHPGLAVRRFGYRLLLLRVTLWPAVVATTRSRQRQLQHLLDAIAPRSSTCCAARSDTFAPSIPPPPPTSSSPSDPASVNIHHQSLP